MKYFYERYSFRNGVLYHLEQCEISRIELENYMSGFGNYETFLLWINKCNLRSAQQANNESGMLYIYVAKGL